MKALSSALLTLFAFSLPGASPARAESDQPNSQFAGWTAEQREVWRTVEQWNDAFEANDADRYFTFIDPDIVVLTPASPFRIEGIAADRREFVFGLARGSGRVAFFQELQPHVMVVGDMAYATYYNRGWYGPQGQERLLQLRETDVLRRRGGSWKITHIHVSDVK